MTKKFLIAELKDFCNESLDHFIEAQKACTRFSASYEYYEGRMESLQMVLNKLDNYD